MKCGMSTIKTGAAFAARTPRGMSGTITESEAMALSFCLEYAEHTPPEQWNLSPEMKEWLREILIKLDYIKLEDISV